MFKKLSLVVLMFFIVVNVHAMEIDGPGWLTKEVTNETGEALTTALPVTTIYPGDRIIFYTVLPDPKCGPSTESYAALYDTTDTNLDEDTNEIISEAEAETGASKTEFLVYPYKVLNQVVVRQGARSTVVIHFVN